MLTKKEIAERLRNNAKPSPENPYPPGLLEGPSKPAAILIPFTQIDDEWHLLFIRRTNNEYDRHGGQVAFPGGRMDSEDPDLKTTALREAHEEVGLQPVDVQILGEMKKFLSISNYLVTPYLGIFPWPYDLYPQPNEVDRIFLIPFNWLANPDSHNVTYHDTSNHEPFPVIYFNPYNGEVVWGFTARVVLDLIDLLH